MAMDTDKKREQNRRYYKRNKDRIAKRNKDYYEQNREHILLKAAEYRGTHREELKQYFRTRYAENREEILALCHYTNLRLLTPEDNLKKAKEDRELAKNYMVKSIKERRKK